MKLNLALALRPKQTDCPLAHLPTTLARLLARRQPHNAPSLHTGWQIVAEEHRILEVLNYELATHTPAAWIEVFEQRLSLWRQQQLQQSRRPLLSLVPPSLLAHGAHVIAEVCVRDQPFTVDTQSCWGISVVPLWCVLDLSPTGRSPPEVTQRRFAPSGRAPLHYTSVLCMLLPARFRSVSVTELVSV